MPTCIETEYTTQRITRQPKIERFLSRAAVLELAIERSSIQEADARLSRVDADARAIGWALESQGVPLIVIDGELAIDEGAWQRASDYVCRHADEIVAAQVHLPHAVRQAVINLAIREGNYGR